MNDIMIGEKIEMLQMYKAYIREYEAMAKDLEYELRGELESRGVDSVEACGHKVSYKMVHSSRFDSKAFREDNPGEYGKYIVDKDYMRFEIA